MKKSPAKVRKSGVPMEKPDEEVLNPLDLLLDPFNPGLHPSEKGKSQERLIEVMLERFSIHEIAESICSAGFLPLDPFIGYQNGLLVNGVIDREKGVIIQELNLYEVAPPRFAKT